MKKIGFLLLLASSVLSFNAFSQIRKIPSEVTESFKKIYPDAAKVEWKDKITSFAAYFEQDGKKHEARFKDDGEWQYTETDLPEDSLPEEVRLGLSKSKFSDWKTHSVVQISYPQDSVHYKFVVSKSDLNKRLLTFNSEGKLLKEGRTL